MSNDHRTRRMRLCTAGAVVAGFLAMVVAGCGGSSAGAAGTTDATTVATTSAQTVTAPAPSGASPVVWAVGDGSNGGSDAIALARSIAAAGADRFLYLGDVYEHGTADEFNRGYHDVYGALDPITDPTPGNHDWPNHATGYDPYWSKVRDAPIQPWYATSIAGWQLISLNSEEPHRAGSPQIAWLDSQLRTPGDCRIAFWHRPRFSAGRHGDQKDMAPVWDALRGHAAIVLNGHDHDMQRFKPRDGITEFVSGAGGKGLYGVDEGDSRLAFSNDTELGALRLVLSRGRADYRFVTTDGRVLDAGTLTCRPG